MKVLISGILGFVGSSVARAMRQDDPSTEIFGFDNGSRAGSQVNKSGLESLGIKVIHADVRMQTDVDNLPAADWIIDAAANPSVLAGVDGVSTSRQVIESNLYSTVNLLEYAKRHHAGFILLSTSRVYSINALQSLQFEVKDDAFALKNEQNIAGISPAGINERFSTQAPISIYGSTKLCSEALILEYGHTFDLPVWINRCGVLAGQGQFGRADQGIFTFWINSYLRKRPLKYVGFGGNGYQVRDCMHPNDLYTLLKAQMAGGNSSYPRIFNLGGGKDNCMSLKQLSNWCSERFGKCEVKSETEDRAFDIPWVSMDSSLAQSIWGWRPQTSLLSILDEIAIHAEKHPDWLTISGQ